MMLLLFAEGEHGALTRTEAQSVTGKRNPIFLPLFDVLTARFGLADERHASASLRALVGASAFHPPLLPSTCPPPPERVSYRRMEPALPVKYMVWVLLETLPSASTTIRLGVLQVAADFVQDKITKTEVLSPFKQDIVPHPTPHLRRSRCNHRRRRRFAFSTTRPRHAADSWADSSCREACLQTRAQGFGRTVPLHPPRPSRRAPRIC